jgi:Lar family restriction alleviation protein
MTDSNGVFMSDSLVDDIANAIIKKSMTDSKIKLKPCPFCGNKDVKQWGDFMTPDRIACEKCRSRGPMAENRNQAADFWNRRAK